MGGRQAAEDRTLGNQRLVAEAVMDGAPDLSQQEAEPVATIGL